MDEKQLAKLIKKNTAHVERAQQQKSKAKQYDSTLHRKETEDTDVEREQFFDEMKRREF